MLNDKLKDTIGNKNSYFDIHQVIYVIMINGFEGKICVSSQSHLQNRSLGSYLSLQTKQNVYDTSVYKQYINKHNAFVQVNIHSWKNVGKQLFTVSYS